MPAFESLMLLNPSPRLGSTPLFLARGIRYSVDDAIAAAIFRGDLDGAIHQTLTLAAAEERAARRGYEPDEDELQARSEKFRYQHDLISAGETEQWLETRGLTTDDFGAWLYQQLCPGAVTAWHDLLIPDDFADLLRVHLWMSGQMDKLSVEFSRRISADIEIWQRGETLSTEPVMQQFLQRHSLDEETLPGWLAALGRDSSWLRDTLRREAAFDRLCSLVRSEDARARQLASMQSLLVRIQVETLELDSEAAAREASLCVREDGATLSDVARETGYFAERAEIWMDTLDENLGQRLLSAAEGEVIGPVSLEGRFKIYQVLRKVPPKIADPVVARRIDEMLLEQFFTGLCARHIQTADAVRTSR